MSMKGLRSYPFRRRRGVACPSNGKHSRHWMKQHTADRRASPSTARSTRFCPCGYHGIRCWRQPLCKTQDERAMRPSRSGRQRMYRRRRRVKCRTTDILLPLLCARGCGLQSRHLLGFARQHRERLWNGCLCPFRQSAPRRSQVPSTAAPTDRMIWAQMIPVARHRWINNRIFFARIEMGRFVDHAPDVGLSVAAFRCEYFGRIPARFTQLVVVPLLDSHHWLVVRGSSQFHDRREINARPGIDIKLAFRREDDAVVCFYVGERCQAGAIKVNAIGMHVIRIFTRFHTARLEPDEPLLNIDVIDIAHDPVALRDLVLYPGSRAVVEVEMLPSVTLRTPDDFLAVIDVDPNFLAGIKLIGNERTIVNKSFALLVNESVCCSGLSVYLNNAIGLMAALVVLKGESAAVLPPCCRREVVGIGKEVIIDDGLALRLYVEEDRLL